MSILKNILSPFFEFKDEQKTELTGEQNSAPAQRKINLPGGEAKARPAPDLRTYNSGIASSTSGNVEVAEYKKHFEDLMEEANSKNPLFQGTDLKEFIDSKVDVAAITDEATRYKTAFNVLKRTG